MKAAFIKKVGSSENISYGDLPKPKPGPEQVLVKIKAAAINPVDTYIRSGRYPMDLPMPFIVGCDLAGVVESVGKEATKYKKGDRVWGSNQGMLGRQGTFAEYAAVDECWLYPTPEDVSDQEAAAAAMSAITAHLGLFREAQLKMGETVFVSGAGGVGSSAIQMAKAVGARVFADAGCEQRVQLCRQLGATNVINRKTDDLAESLQELGPFNVWLETRHDQDFDLILKNMAIGGRVVILAGSDSRPELPVGLLYRKDCKLLGFSLMNAPSDEQRKCTAEINRWLGKGRFHPQIDRVMKLSEAAESHRLQESRFTRKAGVQAGKIVVTP
jgi:NADPH:quinone reductase